MSDAHDIRQFAVYVRNLMQGTSRLSKLALAMSCWLQSEGEEIGILVKDEWSDDSAPIGRRRKRGRPRVNQVTSQEWQNLLLSVDLLPRGKPRPDQMVRNLRQIAIPLGLDDLEQDILKLSVAYGIDKRIEGLIDALFPSVYTSSSLADLLAKMLGTTRLEVMKRLRTAGLLVGNGLITIDANNQWFSHVLKVEPRFLQAMLPPQRGLKDFCAALFQKPLAAGLRWDDFAHLGDERDILCGVLNAGLAGRERGLNVLLYGKPGTGKTELCKVVAARLGAKLYAVGEADEHGGEPNRGERLAALKMADRLLPGNAQTLLLFDEMEDLIQTSYRQAPLSKVFINRLLETNAVPILWTCNDIESFDPALLRRMTLAIEIKVPPPRIREGVWNRILKKQGLCLPAAAVQRLAHDFEAPPALAASAVRAARLAGGGEETLRQTVRGIAKAMQGGQDKAPRYALDTRYDARLINANLPLTGLTDRLAKERARQFSFCLSGPPGTGKSAWARHLADRMGMEVLHKRASDLLSKWLGESEKNIAAAFAEAASRKALLIFDEVDSLLADRRGAEHAWQISQVNEMMTWMEIHPLPFVCTTNLVDTLDHASLRRFTFKVQFAYLRHDQTDAAYQTFFGRPPPSDLSALHALTPADFAVVHRKAGLLGQSADDPAIIAMLDAECRAKPDAPRAIGFAI